FITEATFDAMLEVREDDTIRCVLVQEYGNYLTNPVTKETFHFYIKEIPRGFRAEMYDLKFEIDADESRMLDYNLMFIVPSLTMEDEYKKISGTLDTLPEGAKLLLLVDGGYQVEESEFSSRSFELSKHFKVHYINLYVKSKYGWIKHVKEYDIKKFSLVFPSK
ncbi:hypothetical protein ACFL5V_13410, partial [Fibrobacterota bacterium]